MGKQARYRGVCQVSHCQIFTEKSLTCCKTVTPNSNHHKCDICYCATEESHGTAEGFGGEEFCYFLTYSVKKKVVSITLMLGSSMHWHRMDLYPAGRHMLVDINRVVGKKLSVTSPQLKNIHFSPNCCRITDKKDNSPNCPASVTKNFSCKNIPGAMHVPC